jgi:integrase
MATLYLQRGIWYINYAVDGKRFKLSTGTRDKKLAQIKFEDLKVKLFKGELGVSTASASGANVGAFFRRFIDFARANYANQHLQSDLSRIKNVQDFLARKGVKHIGSITPGQIEEFMTVILDGRSPKTRKNYLALPKTMLNYAVKWNVLDKNPIAGVKPPKIVKKFRSFSKAQTSKLIEKAQEPLRTAIIILVNTGLRRAELFNLRWRDVDLEAGKLRVWPYEGFTPKGKRPRSIPLNDAVLKTLMALRDIENDSAYVLRPYSSIHTLRRQFTLLAKRLKMAGTLHDLRHTLASHLAMAGTPIPVIKELLGHSDIATTMIYAHLSPEQHKGEVNKSNFRL